MKKSLCLLGLFCLVGAPAPVVAAESKSKVVQPGRVESAKELTKESKQFQLNAKQFQVNMQESERRAKKLQGAAEKLEVELRTGQGRLDGAKLKSAIGQHALDVSKFVNHAQQYSAHLKDFHKLIGECDNAEAEFQANLKKYSLHCEQFHIPDVEPPTHCPRMVMSEADMATARAELLGKRTELEKVQSQLQITEARLNQAVQDGAKAQIKVLKQAETDEKLQSLVGEFKRLKEEYETLQIQQAAINGSKGTSITQTAVRGKVGTGSR